MSFVFLFVYSRLNLQRYLPRRLRGLRIRAFTFSSSFVDYQKGYRCRSHTLATEIQLSGI